MSWGAWGQDYCEKLAREDFAVVLRIVSLSLSSERERENIKKNERTPSPTSHPLSLFYYDVVGIVGPCHVLTSPTPPDQERSFSFLLLAFMSLK